MNDRFPPEIFEEKLFTKKYDWSMTVPNSDGDPMSIPVSPRVPNTSWSVDMHPLLFDKLKSFSRA
ncbi:hypothetical protein C5167_000659 [Papaver somniferum]|uniref:Uncharacterized protein n=1 Tax=Papaver somniferum TaxID=3469 RepID=A0A4Y7KVV0_PAPSO|nr:hypothetical protein C5167_000659 [Papaver somniferum]